MKKILARVTVSLITILPAVAAAQPLGPPPSPFGGGESFGRATELNDIGDVVNFIIRFINRGIIPIIFSLALLYFLYGIAQYIKQAGDPKARDNAAKMMLYGIIGLFVMTSVWGLVNLVANTFSLDNNRLPNPQFRR